MKTFASGIVIALVLGIGTGIAFYAADGVSTAAYYAPESNVQLPGRAEESDMAMTGE